MTRRIYLMIGAAVLIAVASAGTTMALASGSTPQKPAKSAQPLVAAQTSGPQCRAAYDTQQDAIYPPTGSTSVDTVTMTKPCSGSVVANLTSETYTNSTNNPYLEATVTATCTGTGGFATHCTVGESKDASPGVIFLESNQETIESHSATEVLTGLKPGTWRFDAVVYGDGNSQLDYRVFSVEAYKGG